MHFLLYIVSILYWILCQYLPLSVQSTYFSIYILEIDAFGIFTVKYIYFANEFILTYYNTILVK